MNPGRLTIFPFMFRRRPPIDLQVTQNDLLIQAGSAYVYYAFDVGSSIDLDKAERLLVAARKTSGADRKRPGKYFEYTPPPVRWTEESPIQNVGDHFATLPSVEILLFDFGCVSVRFEIRLDGPMSRVIDLSVDLYENAKLQEAARVLVTELVGKIGATIDKPEIATRVEDYCVFNVSRLDPPVSVAELSQKHFVTLTGILRADHGAPSDREAQEIMADRISYGSNDLTLLSWHAALIIGEDTEDIHAVLEFANILLLELSYLDSRLDRSLDSFYEFFNIQSQNRLTFTRSKQSLMRRISELQIESAVLFERITNGLKLMGDAFQAQIFRVATKKMGLSSWDASILRKLETIESIYQKISDAEGSRRMELLEIVIIILFLISIVTSMKFG